MKLYVKKPAFIANERKLKVVNDFVSHKGSNILVALIKINFPKIGQEQNKPMLDTLWLMILLTITLKI